MLGRVCSTKGDLEDAIEHFKKVLELGEIGPMFGIDSFVNCIMKIEMAYERLDRKTEFVDFYHDTIEKKTELLEKVMLVQWYLEPKEPSGLFTETAFVDEFDRPALKSAWEWVNSKGDSSYRLLSEANGLEVCSSSGSDLWRRNSDAPRLLRELSGDFTVEVKLKAVSEDLPSVGGVLIWKDEENYIRFERGMHGKDEIRLLGNVQSERAHFGRGMLTSDILYLRLERIGDRISAYCSSNGENWMTCGEVDFSAEDPIQVGIHAIGSVGLRGAYMDTATRFDYFKVLRKS